MESVHIQKIAPQTPSAHRCFAMYCSSWDLNPNAMASSRTQSPASARLCDKCRILEDVDAFLNKDHIRRGRVSSRDVQARTKTTEYWITLPWEFNDTWPNLDRMLLPATKFGCDVCRLIRSVLLYKAEGWDYLRVKSETVSEALITMHVVAGVKVDWHGEELSRVVHGLNVQSSTERPERNELWVSFVAGSNDGKVEQRFPCLCVCTVC